MRTQYHRGGAPFSSDPPVINTLCARKVLANEMRYHLCVRRHVAGEKRRDDGANASNLLLVGNESRTAAIKCMHVRPEATEAVLHIQVKAIRL